VKFVGKPELLAETFRPFFLPAKFPIDVLDKSVFLCYMREPVLGDMRILTA
jgi:hypothetical protein